MKIAFLFTLIASVPLVFYIIIDFIKNIEQIPNWSSSQNCSFGFLIIDQKSDVFRIPDSNCHPWTNNNSFLDLGGESEKVGRGGEKERGGERKKEKGERGEMGQGEG